MYLGTQKPLPTLAENVPDNSKPSHVSEDKLENVSEDTPEGMSEPAEPIYLLYIAKYDYRAKTENEMSFKRGDQLYIINKNDGEDWWFAKAKYSGQEGCVPNNYITKSHLDTEE